MACPTHAFFFTHLRGLGDGDMTARVGGEIRQFLAGFYADDGLVQSRCPVMLQTLLCLRTNVSKMKIIGCVPGRIRTYQTRETYIEWMEGHAESGQWKRRRVGCDVCGEDLAAPLLRSHLEA